MPAERPDPGGTVSPGPDHLTATATTPGNPDASTPQAAPGAYEADEEEKRRGRARKPGN